MFCTSVGVLNYGSSTVEMSMKIGERLLTLSLRDAQATTDKDQRLGRGWGATGDGRGVEGDGFLDDWALGTFRKKSEISEVMA